MNTKILSEGANAIIDQYKDVPYFNNKTTGRRGALRVQVGKGSPKEIFDEIKELSFIQKVDTKSLDSSGLKKFMVDNNIGIDCSGFAYFILNEESISRGKGTIDKHLHFLRGNNIFSRLIAKFKPVTNTDVLTLADNKNSKVISNKDAKVGDMITMVGGTEGGERNHILIINQIEYQNSIPMTLHYIHAVSWPTDGEYNHGIHRGKIEITDVNKNILEQRWIELEKEGEENYTYSRAKKSTTEIRRLKWFD